MTLSELELDAITELVNLGVSRAATNLALMVHEEVVLTVPKVALLSRQEAIRTLSERESKHLVAVHQVFEGDIAGRALLIFPEERSLELVRCVVGSELSLEEMIELEQEALAETGNVILNSCLATIANSLDSNLQISLPEVVARRKLAVFQPRPAADRRDDHPVHLHQLRGSTARHRGLHRDDDGHALAHGAARTSACVDPADARRRARVMRMPGTEHEHAILDAIATGLVVLGTDRTIVHWNSWMVSASRRSESEVIGQRLEQVFPEAKIRVLGRAIESAIEAGASTLLTNALHTAMLPLKTRAGRQLLHDIVVSPVGHMPRRGCVVQIADVTDTTRRERFLRDRQNARYDALVESAPDAILNVDSQGIIRLANPAAARQFGYQAGELIGKRMILLFESENAWLDIERSASSTTASHLSVEVLIRRNDGSLRYFDVSAARWQDGTRTVITTILRDVNDRRDTEMALRKSEGESRANAKALAELNEVLKERGRRCMPLTSARTSFLRRWRTNCAIRLRLCATACSC